MIVLLPGMDGTGDLLLPFLQVLPECQAVRVIRYPTDHSLSYAELERYVISAFPIGEPITLIAESFSGPIALRLSTDRSLNLRAVVVVCGFASHPLGFSGTILARLPLSWLFKLEVPPIILRTFLLGNDASDELLRATAQAIWSVRPNVLADRLREALTSRYCSVQITPVARVVVLFSEKDRLIGKKALKVDHADCGA